MHLLNQNVGRGTTCAATLVLVQEVYCMGRGCLQGKAKRPSRRTLKRLPQDIRHQLEQLQVPPELLANPKVTIRIGLYVHSSATDAM
jgi:hypothetical protein